MEEVKILHNRDLYEIGVKKCPYTWNLETHPQMLIVGNTGSGKTYAEKLIVGVVAKDLQNVQLTICDFKGQDFREFKGLPRYYGSKQCMDGLNAYYTDFQQRQEEKDNSNNPKILLFDEWGAFILSREKKEADTMKSRLSELLMLGRSFNFHVIVGLQRADSSHFLSGARDQFSATLGLGNLSKEQKQMLFSEYKDNMIDDCGRGTGYFLRDGQGIARCVVPTISDETIAKVNRTIQRSLTI